MDKSYNDIASDNQLSTWTVSITKGTSAPLCAQIESEDVRGVIGIIAAKVLCSYLFVLVVFVAVRREYQWAKLLSGGMFDSDDPAPQEGQAPAAAGPDKPESAVKAVAAVAAAAVVISQAPADDQA